MMDTARITDRTMPATANVHSDKEPQETQAKGIKIRKLDSAERKLSIYLDFAHGYVRLTIPERKIDAYRGFYKDGYLENSSVAKKHGGNRLKTEQFNKVRFQTKPKRSNAEHKKLTQKFESIKKYINKVNDMLELDLSKSFIGGLSSLLTVEGIDGRGMIVNEEAAYGSTTPPKAAEYQVSSVISLPQAAGNMTLRDLKPMAYEHSHFSDQHSHIDFQITKSEARKIEHYIANAEDKCNSIDNSECFYNYNNFNCLDFIQNVFEQTNYSGHFSDYFPYSKLTGSLAGAYLAVFKSNKPFNVVSTAAEAINTTGTIMLGATLLKSLPQLAKSLFPETSIADPEGITISREKLQKAVKNAHELSLFLDKVFEDYYAVNDEPLPGELVDLSVDIQSKIYDLEIFVKKHSYKESVRSYIKKELNEIKKSTRDFIDQFPKSSTESP